MELIVVAAFIIGCGIGVMLSGAFARVKTIGSLVVNETDPDGPYLFLKLKEHPQSISKQSYVTMQVEVQKPDSQK